MKSKVLHDSCVTHSGTKPMAARLASVAFGLPSMASAALPVSVSASDASMMLHAGGLAKLPADAGLRPAGVRSCATAALNCACVVTALPLMSLP